MQVWGWPCLSLYHPPQGLWGQACPRQSSEDAEGPRWGPPSLGLTWGGRLAESQAHCTQNEEREHSEALGGSTFFLNGHHGEKPALCGTWLRREAEQDLLAFALLSLKPSEEEDEQK